MNRLRRVLKKAGVVLTALAVVWLGLYQFFGLRMVLSGGGRPTFRFVESSEALAARIEAHRAAQRDSRAGAEPSNAAAAASDVNPEPAPGAPPVVEDVVEGTAGSVVDRLPASPDIAVAAGPDFGTSAAPTTDTSAPWSDFRGARRDGVYREGRIRTDWPAAGLAPMWQQPAGGGYASFVVAGGRAFTIEQRAAREVVAAYDVITGRELWTNTWETDFRESMGGDGPRATPTWAAGRVYALGATGELRSLDEATGRVLWRTNILSDAGASNLQWGMAAAPLVVDNAVVVLPGGAAGQSVLAYDRATGKKLWTALPDQAAYASPMLVTLGGVRQILVFSAQRLVGLSVDGGTVLWEHA